MLWHCAGDVNNAAGISPFPGNINQIVLQLGPYATQLEATGGVIEEFVNPKYRDASRTAFKKATRLECMMQDYPKTLPADKKCGFTTFMEVCCPLLWARRERCVQTSSWMCAASCAHGAAWPAQTECGSTMAIEVGGTMAVEVGEQTTSAGLRRSWKCAASCSGRNVIDLFRDKFMEVCCFLCPRRSRGNKVWLNNGY